MSRIAFRGNFSVDYSTESHVAASLELMGHEVVRLQESEVDWATTTAEAEMSDMLLWVQTYGYAVGWGRDVAADSLARLRDRGVPSVGFHLDLWWGLDRADQLTVEPFFRVAHLFTADGDHDDGWASLGVNHHWSPPAVFGPECVPGMPQGRYRSDVAFVGSWQHYGHAEWWPYRKATLDFLKATYRSRVRFWPRGRAVRGRDLNNLYASVKVVVGDSCFADRAIRYFSDRAFETVGRGGFLVMPYIPGLADLLEDGKHCRYYPWGDHQELRRLIDFYVTHDEERERIRTQGQEHVRASHTYEDRMRAVLATVGVGV